MTKNEFFNEVRFFFESWDVVSRYIPKLKLENKPYYEWQETPRDTAIRRVHAASSNGGL